MKRSNINLILMLTSGIIVGIIGVYLNYPLVKLAYTLVVVLALFFILGTILDYFFNKIVAEAEAELDVEAEAEGTLSEEEGEELNDDEMREDRELESTDEFTEEDFENEVEDLMNIAEGEIVSKEDD